MSMISVASQGNLQGNSKAQDCRMLIASIAGLKKSKSKATEYKSQDRQHFSVTLERLETISLPALEPFHTMPAQSSQGKDSLGRSAIVLDCKSRDIHGRKESRNQVVSGGAKARKSQVKGGGEVGIVCEGFSMVVSVPGRRTHGVINEKELKGKSRNDVYDVLEAGGYEMSADIDVCGASEHEGEQIRKSLRGVSHRIVHAGGSGAHCWTEMNGFQQRRGWSDARRVVTTIIGTRGQEAAYEAEMLEIEESRAECVEGSRGMVRAEPTSATLILEEAVLDMHVQTTRMREKGRKRRGPKRKSQGMLERIGGMCSNQGAREAVSDDDILDGNMLQELEDEEEDLLKEGARSRGPEKLAWSRSDRKTWNAGGIRGMIGGISGAALRGGVKGSHGRVTWESGSLRDGTEEGKHESGQHTIS